MRDILHRYFAGDKSLLEEIEANAKSDHPMAQMARDSLHAGHAEELEEKKRKRAIEDAELQSKMAATQSMRVTTLSTFTNLMTTLNPNWTKDTRLVLQTQDLLKSTMFHPGSIADSASSDNELVTLSQYARDHSYPYSVPHLKKVGMIASKQYKSRYGEKPGQHEQYVDGAVRMVNSYSKKDFDIVEEAFAKCV